ncbi:MAG: hypothetical protein H7836_17860 [Magnetococcus sp. YQC-3]
MYKKKEKKNSPLVISNVPYSFVDVVFSTKEEFKEIIKNLINYIKNTNEKEELKKYNTMRPIYMLIDESHLYFYSREFKNNISSDDLIVLSQCRKRKISIEFIVQDL